MNINYTAPINSLGYGQVGYNFLKGLISKGLDPMLFEIGQIEQLVPDMSLILKAAFSQNPRPIDKNATSLRIWHQNELHPRIGNGKHIGFPIFELDTFSAMERNSLLSCDELIVCSWWAKKVIHANGINIPVHVIPLGYDPSIFNSNRGISPTGPTIFFNCGKWEIRKGHDVLLRCFEKAFDVNDNVELWMMCHNPFPQAKGKEWERIYSNSKMGRKIKLIPRQDSHKNVAYIMGKTDCGVFPARAEGWNLELLEMMACGRHVIATNYSAHTEFTSKESCRLIPIQKLEKAVDNVWFHGQGNWANIDQPEEDYIIHHMRDIHNQKQAQVLQLNTAAIDQANKFTWEKSTGKLIDVL